MRQFYRSVFLISFICLNAIHLFAQQINVTAFQQKELNNLSRDLGTQNILSYKKAFDVAIKKGWKINDRSANGSSSTLKGIDELGFPIYFKTYNNTTAAATTRTNTVQPGGILSLNLSGSSTFLTGKIAIWDEGIVYAAHNEFAGKTIKIGDGATNILDHATHVAGTMIAKGVYGPARGMSFGATTLLSYDYNNDQAEMAAAASGLLISNHSYGYEAGWNYNTTQSRWEWDGLPGDTEDYKFGFYSNEARNYDAIAFNAPQYLIVQAAGNSHADTGPAVGDTYYGYTSKTDQTIINKGPRPAGISNNDGYDVISGTANAKNILTVGAVYPLPNGPTTVNSVQIGGFSSWGPTDDGRVKPDICGDGINVLSTGTGSPNAYLTLSGTSMSTPNVSGSLFLLQEYYAQKNSGNFMRSATLKGLACHTAFDAGRPGPDYIFGWGLLDMGKAAQAITDNGAKSLINEQTLAQGQSQSYTVVATGTEALKATIAWTDPKGTPSAYGTINDRTPKLVNDLDIRVSDGSNLYKPWVLDPANPSANAVTGDNIRDNVEQVLIAAPVAAKTYTITVSHKGHLLNELQNYSLIVTGIQSSKFTSTGVTDISLSVYPVPASSQLNIALNAVIADKLTIGLYNSTGQKMYSESKQIMAGEYTTSINVANLASGLYYLQIKLGDKAYGKTVPVVR